MNERTLRDELAAIVHGIAPEANFDTIPPTADLREALDIDSFDFLRVLQGIHERLHVEIPESDYAGVRTLEALLAYISARTTPQRTGR